MDLDYDRAVPAAALSEMERAAREVGLPLEQLELLGQDAGRAREFAQRVRRGGWAAFLQRVDWDELDRARRARQAQRTASKLSIQAAPSSASNDVGDQTMAKQFGDDSAPEWGLYVDEQRKDLSERKSLKVKLPLRQHIKLHAIKMFSENNISETIEVALDLYFEKMRELELAARAGSQGGIDTLAGGAGASHSSGPAGAVDDRTGARADVGVEVPRADGVAGLAS